MHTPLHSLHIRLFMFTIPTSYSTWSAVEVKVDTFIRAQGQERINFVFLRLAFQGCSCNLLCDSFSTLSSFLTEECSKCQHTDPASKPVTATLAAAPSPLTRDYTCCFLLYNSWHGLWLFACQSRLFAENYRERSHNYYGKWTLRFLFFSFYSLL